jgi:hypothetical protein
MRAASQIWLKVIGNAALTGAVIEIAARAGVGVPQTRAVHDLVTALGDVGDRPAGR